MTTYIPRESNCPQSLKLISITSIFMTLISLIAVSPFKIEENNLGGEALTDRKEEDPQSQPFNYFENYNSQKLHATHVKN